MQIQSSSTESQQNNNNQKIIYGNAIFSCDTPKVVKDVIDIVEIKNVLVKNNWRIKKKHFTKEWMVLWKYIVESSCQRIMIESENPYVLQQLTMCRFPNLTVLNLSHNFITSIQPLTFLDAPNLQFLYLETNQISNLKSLSKFYYQNLQQVDLSGNKVSCADQIARMKITKNKNTFSIQVFSFTRSHHHHHALQEDGSKSKIQDIAVLAKFEHHFKNTSQINQNQRQKKYDMLKRQLQYLFMQDHNHHQKLTTAIPQIKSLQSLSRKFFW